MIEIWGGARRHVRRGNGFPCNTVPSRKSEPSNYGAEINWTMALDHRLERSWSLYSRFKPVKHHGVDRDGALERITYRRVRVSVAYTAETDRRANRRGAIEARSAFWEPAARDSDRVRPMFGRANTNHVDQLRDEDLAIADFIGASIFENRVDDRVG